MLLPLPESWLVVAIAILPLNLLAIVLHELGHALAARMVNAHVLAWGVGIRKPWFRWRLGKSTFYLGRPVTMGLTIHLPDQIERRPRQQFCYVLGGPFATLFGLSLGLGLHFAGATSDVLTTWIWMSAFLSLVCLVPFRVKSGRIETDNDALQLLDILRYGTQAKIQQLGGALRSVKAIAALLGELRQPEGAAAYDAFTALVEVQLSDSVGAAQSLARAESHGAARTPLFETVASLCRAIIAVVEQRPDAGVLLDRAAASVPNDRVVLMYIDALRVYYGHQRGVNVQPLIEDMHCRAVAAGQENVLAEAEGTQFQFGSQRDSDPETRCRDLIKRYERYVCRTTACHLLAHTAERLAAAGNFNRAQALIAETEELIQIEATTIDSESTRAAFVTDVLAPARRLTAAHPDIFPPPDEQKILQAVAQKAVFQAPVSRGKLFGWITLMLATTCLVLAVASRRLLAIDPSQDIHHPGPAVTCAIAVIGLWFLSLLTTCISLMRSERRFRLLILSSLLIIASMVISHEPLKVPEPAQFHWVAPKPADE